ncbi:MAG: peptidoglycan-binding domain-containing protein [Eggerthellaceae bacterium]|nr:peptidoglycan-binding domain-containing protein [Eggerthellaceae bacterium]
MAKYFAQASIDENGRIAGGAAGNQNGKELNTRELYSSSSRPWLFTLRAINAAVQAEACKQAKAGVSNPFIGYDQNARNTLLAAAKSANWQLANITTPCETDCSAFGAVCLIAAVYNVLGKSAGDEVYNAMYAGGNLPATMNMEQKGRSCSKYIQVIPFGGFGSMLLGDVVTRDGHTVICVDQIVSSNGLKGGTTSSPASSSYPCKGWTGDEVRKLQSALISKGYSCGSCGVDGSFGSDTQKAVLKFQADNGLETDGIVGPKTQAKLYSSAASAVPSSGSGYSTGTYVTCVGELNVRTGAGTGCARKSKHQLTADGQRHSNAAGQLNNGTTVTVMQVQYDGSGNPWGMIPSGWICLEWNGKPYARKA